MTHEASECEAMIERHEVRKCPCNDPGCKRFVVWPTFDSPEASMMREEEAKEIVDALNSADELVKLRKLVDEAISFYMLKGLTDAEILRNLSYWIERARRVRTGGKS